MNNALERITKEMDELLRAYTSPGKTEGLEGSLALGSKEQIFDGRDEGEVQLNIALTVEPCERLLEADYSREYRQV